MLSGLLNLCFGRFRIEYNFLTTQRKPFCTHSTHSECPILRGLTLGVKGCNRLLSKINNCLKFPFDNSNIGKPSSVPQAYPCGRMGGLIHSLLCVKPAWIHLRTHPFYLFYCDSGNKSPTYPILPKVNSHWLKRPLLNLFLDVLGFPCLFLQQSSSLLYRF